MLNPIINLKQTKRGTLVLDGIFLRGVTQVAQSLYYPSYMFKRATKGTVYLVSPKISGVGSNLRGKRLGNMIDRQLQQIHFGKRLPKHILPETEKLLAFFQKQHWEMKYCQFPVGVQSSRLGTNIDVLCWSKSSQRWIILEIKSGYGQYKYKHTGNHMFFPLGTLKDCPFNQHQLQLFLSKMLFCENFPDLSPDAFLLYVDSNKVECFTLPTDPFSDTNETIMKHQLKLSAHELKRDRQRTIRKAKRKKLRVPSSNHSCKRRKKNYNKNKRSKI